MAINDELREMMNMILEHPDEIERLNFFLKLKNGTTINYKVDRRREEKLLEKEQQRQKKLAEKQKRLEEQERVKVEKRAAQQAKKQLPPKGDVKKEGE